MAIHKSLETTNMEVPLLFLALIMRSITSLDEIYSHVIIFEGMGKGLRNFSILLLLDDQDLVMYYCRL